MKQQMYELLNRIVKLCLILAVITLILLQWKATGISEGDGVILLVLADLIIALAGAGWYSAKSGIGAPWIYLKVLVGIVSAAVATVALGALLIVVAIVPGSLPRGGSGGGHHSHFD